MKRVMSVLAVVMIMAMAAPAMAADANKCTASTQDCLNKMANNLQNRGWVGIEMDDKSDTDQIVVTKVIEGSPAERAGFKEGDVLAAVNGVAFTEANEEKLKEIRYSMKPGADFTYTVARNGAKKDLHVELGHIPKNVMAQWVGGHMMDHAEIQMASTD